MKSTGYEIERRENLSYEAFVHEYMYPFKPVIVTDAIQQWPALQLWNPDFFKQQFGHLKFLHYGAGGYEDLCGEKSGTEFTLAELIDQVLASTPERPAPYFRNKVLSELSPGLLQDIHPLPEYLLPNWMAESYLIKRFRKSLTRGACIELFIGGNGGAFPVLHYDGYGAHAFLMQIYGRKEYVLYSPEQEPFLYPIPKQKNQSPINVSTPDFERFPLFQKTMPMTFILEPGEMLFVPSRWWHTARILTPSITVSVNVLNQSNWHELIKYMVQKRDNFFEIMTIRGYLTGAGVWRAWRDRQWRPRVSQRVSSSV